jgi:hypothetical protein
VTDDEKLFTAPPPPGTEGVDVYSAATVATQAPADLLELVRSAEESARVAIGTAPSSATKFHTAGPVEGQQPLAVTSRPPAPDDVVDVTGIAVEEPPSDRATPPPAGAAPVERADAPVTRVHSSAPPPASLTRRAGLAVDARAEPAARGGLPPAVGLFVLLIVAIAVLALVTR